MNNTDPDQHGLQKKGLFTFLLFLHQNIPCGCSLELTQIVIFASKHTSWVLTKSATDFFFAAGHTLWVLTRSA